jgi:hypothetical protein
MVCFGSNTREDAAKLKWDGVRCLFEDAQSDILLLLDTPAVPNATTSGSHGIKQALAACTPERPWRSAHSRSFTSHLVEALQKLGTGRPFSVQRLHKELLAQQQEDRREPQVNGTPRSPQHSPTSLFFTLTPGKTPNLTLSPVAVAAASPRDAGEAQTCSREDLDPDSVADLRFEEARILVCTTFVGDASTDMSYFHQWLQSTPPLGSKIAVEGMFLGPPTMLLISMPHSIWNIVQHDKVCCFLGYISSHNMLPLYEKLVGPTGTKPSAKEVEDGRILLEARERASVPQARVPLKSEGRSRTFSSSSSRDIAEAKERPGFPPPVSPTTRTSFAPINANAVTAKPKDENEGSAEMREAAEQLKALSHVRHRSDESAPSSTRERPRTSLPNGSLESRQNEPPASSPPDTLDVGTDEAGPAGDSKSTPSRIKVPRRTVPKNETRCSYCSHAPFRDSSSLRKHIAAAHTRPFPCAFSFAGCTSTFGSKNEWKRHITSQHLCLQYYRCSACPKSQAEGKGNEFNRKDLFTQHLRRMHAPFQIKRPGAKGDSKIQADWELHVKGMQQSCLVNRRYPPQKSACPNAECRLTFEGHGSWDEWTEHVGRHMEKGEGAKLKVDQYLVDWALEEGIIEPKDGGGYKLTAGGGGSNGNGPECGSAADGKEATVPSATDASQTDDSGKDAEAMDEEEEEEDDRKPKVEAMEVDS